MPLDPRPDLGTHEVTNQPPPIGDRDLWASDPALRALLGEVDVAELPRYARDLGSAEMREAARNANRHGPELRLFDSAGRRLDEVAFHPAWHRFMALSARAGYHATAWEGTDHGHLRHAAMVYLASQVEPGHCCPLTMTYAAQPVLRAACGPAAEWAKKARARDYDPRVLPASEKRALTLGMAMTEKQGGSDVRANTTRAEPDGDAWRLTGHKWFCSAPMSDGFLTLAQSDKGLTCFLVPRWLESGRNGIRLQRLKDKLGNRSNASSEIEYVGALAWQVGAEGDGVRTIVEMVHHTRLDTSMAPAGLMRAALVEAHHWLTHRSAFQRRLIDQPLMRAVLSDVALDWAGSLALGLHVADRFDAPGDGDRAFSRVAVALAKYLANKLCPPVVGEAMEMLGGMGYVEDTGLPLLYREAPLNSIWEGSANVICLDVLRTLARVPQAGETLAAELEAGRGQDPNYDRALDEHLSRWGKGWVPEAEARWFVERSAVLLTASVLLRGPLAETGAAYCGTRLNAPHGRFAGARPADAPKIDVNAFFGA